MKGLLLAGFLFALVALPGAALASLTLDMGFEPGQVCPGDQVQFFFNLENTGGQDETVEFSVTLTWGDFVVGPLTGEFPLAAGAVIQKEFAFTVPHIAPPGTLVIDATATDSGGPVSDQASLEILDCDNKVEGEKSQSNGRALLNAVQKGFREIGVK